MNKRAEIISKIKNRELHYKDIPEELKDDEDYDYTPAVNIIDDSKNNQIINSSN